MDKETENAFKTMGKLVTDGFTASQHEFRKIHGRLDNMEGDMTAMKADIQDVKNDIHYIQNDTKTIPDLFNLIKEQDKDIEALKA